MTTEGRFFSKIAATSRPDACWLWLGWTQRGYGMFRPENSRSTSRRKVLAHRLSYEHFNGPIPDGMVVRHTCDTPACVNPEHLVVGTHAENHADMVVKGRHPRGAGHGMAKLTEADVFAIRASGGVTQEALGRQYGVTQASISCIQLRKSWTHI